MFYLEKGKIVACNMLARLVDFQKTGFSEHYHRIKKPHKVDNFLYRHFKLITLPAVFLFSRRKDYI